MPMGGGKYDELAIEVFKKSGGQAVVVIVVEGSRGSGVSIKEDFSVAGGKYHIKKLPDLLRYVARQIESDLERDTNGNGTV